MASLVVGDDPAMAWGDDSLRQRYEIHERRTSTTGRLIDNISTVDIAYGQLIASLDNTAQDHNNLSEMLTTQVAEALKTLEKKHEDMRRKVCTLYSNGVV